MNVILVVFFVLILFMTIFKEIKRFDSFLEQWPILMSFIPRWSFFAPVPNSSDFYLVYRSFSLDGTPQEWREAYEIKDKRPFHSVIWNPEKRFLKGFLDILLDLIELSNKVKKKSSICTSIPYLHILNCVDSLNHSNSVKRIQFMVLSDSKEREYEVVFRSETHPLRKGRS